MEIKATPLERLERAIEKYPEYTRLMLESDRRVRELDQRFKGAFEHSPVGMALVATDGEFIRTNKALSKITGYSQTELDSMRCQDITHEDDLVNCLNCMDDFLVKKIRSYKSKKRFINKKGQEVSVLVSVSAVYDNYDNVMYFVAQFIPLNWFTD